MQTYNKVQPRNRQAHGKPGLSAEVHTCIENQCTVLAFMLAQTNDSTCAHISECNSFHASCTFLKNVNVAHALETCGNVQVPAHHVYHGVPKFWTYGSVCCACAQRPGLPRHALMFTLRSQKYITFSTGLKLRYPTAHHVHTQIQTCARKYCFEKSTSGAMRTDAPGVRDMRRVPVPLSAGTT